MIIESLIRRATKRGVQGSDANFPGGVRYRFEPRPDLTDGDSEAHVCEVTDKAHIQRLLSITEGFTIYGDDSPAVEPEEETSPADTDASGPDVPVGDTDTDPTLKEGPEDDDLEVEMVKTISEMTVHDASDQLAGLTDAQLVLLSGAEEGGQARTTLLKAIEEEQEIRAIATA